MRRKVEIAGWTLIWTGFLLFGYVGWQLFGTGLVNAGAQEEAQQNLVAAFQDPSTSLPPVTRVDPDEFLEVDEPGDGEFVEFQAEESPGAGEEFAFLRIPKIGVDAVVFEGVDPETLRNGPGHMEDTPLPGQPGNAVLSGHRTTYGSPFVDFDQLEAGDRIEVETAVGVHVYEIRQTIIVAPTDVWVTDHRPGGWLTLTTCHPKFSARERLIVFAEMVDGPNADFIDLHRQRFG